MPANRADFTIKGDMPDPPLYAAELLTQSLLKSGISVKKNPTTTRLQPISPSIKRTVLGSTRSLPLSRIIRVIHEKSDNVYAECLLRQLAVFSGIKPLSARGGLQVIQDFWKKKGLDVNGFYMLDGSGLSPLDRASPRFLADVLTYMSTKSPYASVYEQSLPLAGMEGSVSGFLKDTPLTGMVRLKSGSNQTTTCYAGYYRKTGSIWAVVMMVNHTNVSRNQIRTDMQDFLLSR